MAGINEPTQMSPGTEEVPTDLNISVDATGDEMFTQEVPPALPVEDVAQDPSTMSAEDILAFGNQQLAEEEEEERLSDVEAIAAFQAGSNERPGGSEEEVETLRGQIGEAIVDAPADMFNGLLVEGVLDLMKLADEVLETADGLAPGFLDMLTARPDYDVSWKDD